MNILVASDKFKGSLTAPEACNAIAVGIRKEFPSDKTCNIRTLPIADGGDGIASALTGAASGEWITVNVLDALGQATQARYGIIEFGSVAVIEMAEASGLAQLGDRKLQPWTASSFGTGQLILDAINRKVTRIILGIGGSATNDGGTGMALALGFRFLDSSGKAVTRIPEHLDEVTEILPPLKLMLPDITVACDVNNPLLGVEGCSRIYGPQKGIDEADLSRHESRLSGLVELMGESGKASAAAPGSGAAGGLGFGCLVFLKASLVPGFDLVAEMLQLNEAVAWADLVITGEGRLDRQSLQGKAPYGLVLLARSLNKPTAAFCGALEDKSLDSEFGPIHEIRQPELTVGENMARAAELLQTCAAHAISSLTATIR